VSQCMFRGGKRRKRGEDDDVSFTNIGIAFPFSLLLARRDEGSAAIRCLQMGRGEGDDVSFTNTGIASSTASSTDLMTF
jgi:hypothetical protein